VIVGRGEKMVKSDLIASDTCLLCDSHCGHSYRGVEVKINTGVMAMESESGDFIFFDTCGNPVWICKVCIKRFHIIGGER